jgi:multidrug efflux system outer membrane protein
MRRVLLLLLVVGCWAGPSYKPETVIAPTQRVGTPVMNDSARRFFDSLATARRRDTVDVMPLPLARATLGDGTVSSLAWLDIIRDTTLVRLVDVALRQNRDLQVAIARIKEFRANVGIAPRTAAAERHVECVRELEPDCARFVPRASAYRAGTIHRRPRRGSSTSGDACDAESRRPMRSGAQQASERATALSLVATWRQGISGSSKLSQERSIAEATFKSRTTTLEIARQRFASGVTSELDVRQFEAQVAASAVVFARAERALASDGARSRRAARRYAR